MVHSCTMQDETYSRVCGTESRASEVAYSVGFLISQERLEVLFLELLMDLRALFLVRMMQNQPQSLWMENMQMV